jgi:hypothetical protein
LANYDATYRGLVVRTNDPSGSARVILRVPQVLGTAESAWARPTASTSTLPSIGDAVYVTFEGGDLSQPVYTPLTTDAEALPLPKAPASLTISSANTVTSEGVTLADITVTWPAPTENQDDSTPVNLAGYLVYVTTDNTAWTAGFLVDTNTYVARALPTGRTYYFRVASVNEGLQKSATYASGQITVAAATPPAGTALGDQAAAITNLQTTVTTQQGQIDGKAIIWVQNTAPTGLGTSDKGDIWIDTSSTNRITKVWDGAAWQDITDQQTLNALSGLTQKTTTYYTTSGSPTAPSGGFTAGDLWVDNGVVPQQIKRWSGSAWVVLDVVTSTYLQSRSTNLVTNGSGLLGNNTNFSQFTLDKADTPTGAAAAFRTTQGVTTTLVLDEYITVDPTKRWQMSVQAKQKGTSTTAACYGMALPYDAAKQQITPNMYMFNAGTTTTLAAPLNVGDTTITLTSSANWFGTSGKPAGTATYQRAIIFWDYVDGNGKAWPTETYSRNVTAVDMWADGGISGNVITLRTPWAGPAKPSGTSLSNATSGGSYLYMTSMLNAVVPQSWTSFTSTITGVVTGGIGASFAVGWPSGTAFAKLGFLPNRIPATGAPDTNSQMSFGLISFSDAAAASTDAATALTVANGKNKTTYSASAPGSTANTLGDIWYQQSGNVIMGMWTGLGGTTWQATTLRDEVLSSITVGKLTSGTINAATKVTVGTPAAARMEIDGAAGLTAFDGTNAVTFKIDSATGNVTLKGSINAGSTVTGSTIQSATSGGRFVIRPGVASNGYGNGVFEIYTGNVSEDKPAEIFAIADGALSADNISLMAMSPRKSGYTGRGYIQLFAEDSDSPATAYLGGTVAATRGTQNGYVGAGTAFPATTRVVANSDGLIEGYSNSVRRLYLKDDLLDMNGTITADNIDVVGSTGNRIVMTGTGNFGVKGGITDLDDTGWVTCTLNSGFAWQGTSGSEAIQVRNKFGVIYIRGAVTSTGITTNGTFTVASLPPGFAPPKNVVNRCGTSSGAAAATAFVTSTGDLQIRTNGTLSSYYFFGGFTWLLD